MGKALFVTTGFVTQPNTTLTNWTMASGDSLQVRGFNEGRFAAILSMWADNQVAGYLSLKSPTFHDNVYGMTAAVVASEVRPLLPLGSMQRLTPQDVIVAQQSGSNTSGDIESGSYLSYYEDYPGTAARLATWDQIKNAIESYMYVNNTISLGTSGGYSGSQVITTTVDQWKANRDYALLGYLVSAECVTVGWIGPDTGNLRVGGPGNDSDNTITYDWFARLSRITGLPTIPIINAANKAATNVDGAQDENGTDVILTSIFGLLKGPGGVGIY